MQTALAMVVSLIALLSPPELLCQRTADADVSTCDKRTLVRPGLGVSYKGTVRNDDYRFSATIPRGLVGWGAGPNAPFHGFAIFIASESKTPSCILFEISIHVDLDEGKAAAPEQEDVQHERITVGGRPATRKSSVGSAVGRTYENIDVWLQVPHKKDDDHDIGFTLITSKSDAARTKPIFEEFLASFRFW